MKDLVDAAILKALATYGDAASQEFYRRLAQRRWCSTRCSRCERIAWPPRGFCPFCHGREVAWVDLPARGTLYAFTQQHRAPRFMTPDVLGLVDLPEVGRLLTRIDAPFESLAIGAEVEVDFLEAGPGLWVHQFGPVKVTAAAVPGPGESSIAGGRASR